jgi:hypothetical protein
MAEYEFHDRFERAFKERVPRDVVASFSAEQLAAIKTAFGGERWDGHPVDMRATVPHLRWYFVFVAGRDKRSKSRLNLDNSPRPSILGRIIGAVVLLIMLALLAFLLIGVMAG